MKFNPEDLGRWMRNTNEDALRRGESQRRPEPLLWYFIIAGSIATLVAIYLIADAVRRMAGF